MKYNRFEDLPCWKAGMELAEGVYRLTKERWFSQSGDLKDQIRRAALSVSNNIAEGFERGTTAELLGFLYIARGSAGEVRSMLRFVERMIGDGGRGENQISNLKSQISDLKSHKDGTVGGDEIGRQVGDLIPLAESCSRQIRGWADSLQNSNIQGQRHLNDKVRREIQRTREREELDRELKERLRKARPDIWGEPEEKG